MCSRYNRHDFNPAIGKLAHLSVELDLTAQSIHEIYQSAAYMKEEIVPYAIIATDLRFESEICKANAWSQYQLVEKYDKLKERGYTVPKLLSTACSRDIRYVVHSSII